MYPREEVLKQKTTVVAQAKQHSQDHSSKHRMVGVRPSGVGSSNHNIGKEGPEGCDKAYHGPGGISSARGSRQTLQKPTTTNLYTTAGHPVLR